MVGGIDFAGLVTVAVAVLVPIFVAMDPVGAIPLVLAWTGGLPARERERQLTYALLTALGVGLVFLVAGRWLLAVLGVTVSDFLIAGGLLLLVLAVSDLVVGGSHEARGSLPRPDMGVVPIGTPILAGPATLTTLLVLLDLYGLPVTSAAFLANLLVAWRLFRQADAITRLFGRNGLRAGSKVISLLLAAIAIKYIREGIVAAMQMVGA